MVLFALVLLTGLGLGLMQMTDTETGINSNFRAEMQAYYASKAGLEEARERLRQYAPTNGLRDVYSVLRYIPLTHCPLGQ
jgi:Tfp pilus assembly protein PilX